jgi:hypothetical protein
VRLPTSNLQTPTYEKLDRVFISTEWKFKYPTVTLHTLNRAMFDHTPLLLNTRVPSKRTTPMFKFKLSWLFKECFHEMVIELWQREQRGLTPIEVWQKQN